MKVVEKILSVDSKRSDPKFSYEIVPPQRGRSVKDIIDAAETLVNLDPQWIDVTSHASSAVFTENSDGSIQKRIYRKRPGTLGICGIIQNRFKIDTVAHILCEGFSREETEDALIELHFLGIHNVLALKGDSPNHQKSLSGTRTANKFASDLVSQIVDLRKGQFVSDISAGDAVDFCIGVAGYPEKHFEAANSKTDILNLKKKVEAGADYVVTQMFYDNQKFFKFVADCRDAGITVPIIPGLKVLKSVGQLKSIPRHFHIDLPDELVDQVMDSPQHAQEIGKNWTQKQTAELIEAGFKNIHFYILNDAVEVANVVRKITKL